MAMLCTLQVAAAPLTISVQHPTNQELAKIAAVPNTGVRLKALDHSWACATGISAKTSQGQLDEKLRYIEDKAPKDGGKFLIAEDVSEEEAQSTAGIRYMYSNSEIYREMVNVSEQVFLASDEYTFSKLANQKTSYERWVFAVEKKSTLNLDLDYDLKEGQMAIWLVSPDGEIIYQNEPIAKFTDDLELDIDAGLWSIILVNHYDSNYELSGSKNIRGTVVAK
jgi:hypothetical protein